MVFYQQEKRRTKLEDKEILHQVEVERVQNGIVKQILIDLEKSNKRISAEIKKTKGIYTKARYKEIAKYLKKEAKSLKSKVTDDTEYEEFIKYELATQKKLMSKYLKGTGINFKFPTLEQAITTATFGQYTASSNFENYLNSVESQFYNIWDSNIREGYLTGLTTQNIVRKVVGLQAQNAQLAEAGAMHTFRQSIQTNTRTALQAMASDTRKLIYEQNSDVISGYKWLATLDRRTCLVCGKFDTQIKTNILDFGEQPPIHYNCRCVIVPVVNGIEELKDNSRANSEEGYSYEEWLKRQDEDVQKDILGKTRFKMYKRGTKIGEFVNDGKILKLDEINKYFVKNSLSDLKYDFNNSESKINLDDKDYIYEITKLNKNISEKIGTTVDLKGSEISSAKTISKRLEYYKEKYPKIYKTLDYIGMKSNAYDNYCNQTYLSLKEVNPTLTEKEFKENYINKLKFSKNDFYLPNNALGSYTTLKINENKKLHYIMFNEKAFRNEEYMLNQLKLSFNNNDSSTFNINGIIDHEIFHALDDFYDLTNREIIKNIFQEYSNKKDFKKYLSNYGLTIDEAEMGAESWAEYFNNGNFCRQFAKVLVQFFLGCINEKKL